MKITIYDEQIKINNKKDNIQCLFKLNYELLTELVEETLNIKNWYIRADNISNRKESISNSDRFNYLKKQAKKANIFLIIQK